MAEVRRTVLPRAAIIAVLVVGTLYAWAEASLAQVRPRSGIDGRRNPCIESMSRCGASVYLGSGPAAGVANQSSACGGRACRTARVVYPHSRLGTVSDFIPIGSSARPRVIVTTTTPSSAGGGGGGDTGGGTATGGNTTGEAAPPPPPPPTAAEAIATCRQPPRSQIHHNPIHRGLTGLDTWLWSDPIDPLVTETTIRGYPVFCVATPYRWEWHTGDGGFYAVTTAGGPHPANPVTHLYETANPRYVLRLDVRWQLVTNYGSAHVTTTTMQPYTVIEVRSVLVDPGAEPHTSHKPDTPPPDRRR